MVFQEKTVCPRCCSAKKDRKLACFLFGISITKQSHDLLIISYFHFVLTGSRIQLQNRVIVYSTIGSHASFAGDEETTQSLFTKLCNS